MFIAVTPCPAHPGRQEGARPSLSQPPHFQVAAAAPTSSLAATVRSPRGIFLSRPGSCCSPVIACRRFLHLSGHIHCFQRPSPTHRLGHGPPQGHATQTLSYIAHLFVGCWPRICLSGVAGAMLVLLITIHPLPARPEEPSVSRCPLNNQRLFQSSRVRRLLPRTS